jgi:hypothetical protein
MTRSLNGFTTRPWVDLIIIIIIIIIIIQKIIFITCNRFFMHFLLQLIKKVLHAVTCNRM